MADMSSGRDGERRRNGDSTTKCRKFYNHLLWMMGKNCRKSLCLMVESILDFGSISMHLPFSGHPPGFHQQFFAHHPAPLFGAVAFVGPATAAPTQTLRNAIGGAEHARSQVLIHGIHGILHDFLEFKVFHGINGKSMGKYRDFHG
jgi:hypothetical protein